MPREVLVEGGEGAEAPAQHEGVLVNLHQDLYPELLHLPLSEVVDQVRIKFKEINEEQQKNVSFLPQLIFI